MSKQGNGESTKSAAEAPLVIAYIAAFAVFAHAWSHFSPPTKSIMELMAVAAKNTQNARPPLP